MRAVKVAETAYRYWQTEGQGKRKGDRRKDEDSLGISMRRLSRHHPSTAAPSCTFCATTRSRPLIFHPVTPINLTAVSESPLWRYPVALSLSPSSLDTLPSAISDFDRCHFRFPDFNVQLLNTWRYVVVWPRDLTRIQWLYFLLQLMEEISIRSAQNWETNSPMTFYAAKFFCEYLWLLISWIIHVAIILYFIFQTNIYDKSCHFLLNP